jgi:signal transduction histidine kinase
MSRLVDQLLAVARLERGEVVPDEDLDLRAGVQTVAIEMAPLAASECDLVLDLPEVEVPVRGNRDALERAVANLVHNALRHTPPETAVEIQVTAGGVLTVRDHGPGLEGKSPAELFRPFVRGQRGGWDGAGLGLAIVSEVACLHDGTVEACDHPEGGAVFTLTLPLRKT